jgi:hypothetical protein
MALVTMNFTKDDGMAKHFGKRIPYLYMII